MTPHVRPLALTTGPADLANLLPPSGLSGFAWRVEAWHRLGVTRADFMRLAVEAARLGLVKASATGHWRRPKGKRSVIAPTSEPVVEPR
jgi:hypothetical protein